MERGPPLSYRPSMASLQPFRRLPFASLPTVPRRPHPYAAAPARDVVVDSAGFGRTRIHVREVGDGPPLLLVHGLMTSSYSWRYVLEPLSRQYRLVIPDLPGAGRSDCPDRPYTAAALATFLGELIAALGLRGCPVVGNSLGGFLCMRLALDDAGAFSRLVNVHGPAFPIPRLRAIAAALALPGAHAVVRRVIARDPERWVWRNVHYFDETLKSREETLEYGSPLSTDAGRRAFLHYLADTMAPAGFATFARDLTARRDAGQAFPVPLLLLYSRTDPLVPPVTGHRLHALVPDAHLEWLDDTSHFAHVDSPDRVVPVLQSFLAGARS
jgi:pimeloyl-ACP methyl ester carboxylesterase